MSHFVAKILPYKEIIVAEIPPGGGEGKYSHPKDYYVCDTSVVCEYERYSI